MSAGPVASLLSIGEPASCSKQALRGLISPGAGVPPNTAVLELLDLIFGSDGDWSVTGTDLRVEANLHDHLRPENVARGRRCRDLVFPLDWNRDGMYNCEPSGDKPAVRPMPAGQACFSENLSFKLTFSDSVPYKTLR